MAGHAKPLRSPFRDSSVHDTEWGSSLPSLSPASNDSVRVNPKILQPLSNTVGHYLSWKDTDPKDYLEHLIQLIIKIANAGRNELLTPLIQNGISLDIQDHLFKTNALHRLAMSGAAGQNAISTLLNHGAKPNIPDETGKTPFYQAVLAGHKSLIKTFLNHPETDPTLETDKGKCPLSCALYHKHLDIAELLLSDHRIGPSLQNKRVLEQIKDIRKIPAKLQSNGEKGILRYFDDVCKKDRGNARTADQKRQSAFDF
jgi:hypothetical protein